MEETVVLMLLVFVMLVGSYMAGSIPLIMSMSEEKLQQFSVFGAGLLVGTALAVIIPEGVRSLDSAVDNHDDLPIMKEKKKDLQDMVKYWGGVPSFLFKPRNSVLIAEKSEIIQVFL